MNGTERVIVCQMHRSPGVFFDHDKGKTHSSGKLLFACRIIPYRGSWLDFEFDAKDIVFARIDRRRKLPVTTLLYALGMDQEGIMDAYYETVMFTHVKNKGWVTKFFPERVRGTRPTYDLVDAATGEVICKAGDKMTPRMVEELIEDGQGHRASGAVRPYRRPLCRQGHHQRGNRRDLGRSRRRADDGIRPRRRA